MKQMRKELKSMRMINKNIFKIKYQISVISMMINKKNKAFRMKKSPNSTKFKLKSNY